MAYRQARPETNSRMLPVRHTKVASGGTVIKEGNSLRQHNDQGAKRWSTSPPLNKKPQLFLEIEH